MKLLGKIITSAAEKFRPHMRLCFAVPFAICSFHALYAFGAPSIGSRILWSVLSPPKANAHLPHKPVNYVLTLRTFLAAPRETRNGWSALSRSCDEVSPESNVPVDTLSNAALGVALRKAIVMNVIVPGDLSRWDALVSVRVQEGALDIKFRNLRC